MSSIPYLDVVPTRTIQPFPITYVLLCQTNKQTKFEKKIKPHAIKKIIFYSLEYNILYIVYACMKVRTMVERSVDPLYHEESVEGIGVVGSRLML